MANKISLSVAGMNLIINTTEDEERVRKLNAVLNSDITQVLDSNPSASLTNAALLCALDYLSRNDRATRSANNLRSQIKDYLADASRSKLEADELSRKNDDLTAELTQLKERVTRMAANETTNSTNEENLRKQIESARYEVSTMSRQLKDMVDQNSSLQSTVSAQSDTITAQTAELNRFADIIRQQNTQLDQQSGLLDDMKRSAEAIKADRDDLIAQLDTVNGEKSDMEGLLNDSFAEADRLKKIISEKENDALLYQDRILALQNALEAARALLEQKIDAQRASQYLNYPGTKYADEAVQEALDEPSTTYTDEQTEEYVPIPEEYETTAEEIEPIIEEPVAEEDSFTFEGFNDFPDSDLDDDIAARLVEDSAFDEAPVFQFASESEEEPESSAENEVPKAPQKNYRLFDAEEGLAEDNPDNSSDEMGVGDDFRTFGQMIADENRRSMLTEVSEAVRAQAQKSFDEDDDDLLPDLSWINDI